MIPEFQTATSSLPIGRYSATIDEFHNYFVAGPQFQNADIRKEIWNELLTAIKLFRTVVPIVSVWIGGSFTTTKLEPQDIDCLFVVDRSEIQKLDEPSDHVRNVLQKLATKGSLKEINLRVDNFILIATPPAIPAVANSDEKFYYESRGHWDDWWQRSRAEFEDTRFESLPRRGYVEVTVDGFSER